MQHNGYAEPNRQSYRGYQYSSHWAELFDSDDDDGSAATDVDEMVIGVPYGSNSYGYMHNY